MRPFLFPPEKEFRKGTDMGAFNFFNQPAQPAQAEDQYSGLERLMQQTGQAVQYQPGMDTSGYSFARPYQTGGNPLAGMFFGASQGPQAGSWMVPTSVYNQINPQTSGGNFLSDIPQALSDMKGGLAVGALPFGVSAFAPGAVGAGEAAASPFLSNAPAGSVFAAPTGAAPAVGLGSDLGASVGTNMLTTAGAAPLNFGASSGFGPLAGGETLGSPLGGASTGATIPGATIPPVAAPPSILDQAKETAKTAAPYAPLLGAAVGAGAGLLGGGTKPAGSITIEEGIPDWLKAYVKPELDKYATDVQNYQTDPYGILPSAMDEFKKTISGQYLDPSTNKYLPEYFRLGAERLKGTLSPSFGYMQAFGANTGYNEALSRGLGDLAVGLYGGAYDKERALQNNALTAAPSFLTGASNATFAPDINFLNTLSGLGKQKTQPYFDNQFASILGGGLAGAGIGNLFK
jgi:hypothetical protein